MNKWIILAAAVLAAACLALLFKERGDSYKAKYLDQAVTQWVKDNGADGRATWRRVGGSVSSNQVQIAVEGLDASSNGVAAGKPPKEITMEYRKRDGRYQWVVADRR